MLKTAAALRGGIAVPRRVVRVHHADGQVLRSGIARIQKEMNLDPEFPAAVLAAAEEAAKVSRAPTLDRTDLPMVTIDPPGAMDLDQALSIERQGSGYRVFYAIADVAAFVEPGGPVDEEAHRRGETLYGADSKVPLHPPVLSEDAASLLPGQDRPALLWTISVDASGEGTDARVERALVRSRAKLDYATVQRQVDRGGADELFTLLREVGELRRERESARGGVSLPLPEQEIDIDGDRWSLQFRRMLPAEEWNAQISLLTGMAAADLMMYAGVGVLRTLPTPDPQVVQKLHRTAKALGIDWPAEQLYPDFIRDLDPARSEHAAMVLAATQLLRGAGYVGFDGAVPAQPEHAALASEYTHVTAPIRRLVDRYTLEVCASLCAGVEVPEWVRRRIDELPRTMAESARRAGQYESEVLKLVEAAVLHGHVGETYRGVVVSLDGDDDTKGVVVVREPAIEAPVTGSASLPLGAEVRVRLAEADTSARSVRFEIA
jgi:exoribonuclease R